MSTAYIALGANLASPTGTPVQTFDAVIVRMSEFGAVTAQSRYYRTAPVGYLNQPEFVNAIVALETNLAPLELLKKLLAVEKEFGRDRSHGIANGPRTLDLDLILLDDVILDMPELTLPHPRMHERAFVLDPLCEIAPDLVHPVSGKTVKELRNELSR